MVRGARPATPGGLASVQMLDFAGFDDGARMAAHVAPSTLAQCAVAGHWMDRPVAPDDVHQGPARASWLGVSETDAGTARQCR
ncbi:hypothetical protein XcuCFBP2542_05820 [Xanthomonas cucurbitae]|uniref:Uncharacterized protein n=1 Tax=Xanthomonas cucurbitae TaxID=56453 RepID=A0A2S7DUI0_9XANT|nr:hypothetical protein XcuCFBP2542_05820 [Xanthomonas cucurbitae]